MKNEILLTVVAFAGPVMMGIVGYFLKELLARIKKMESKQNQVLINQQRIDGELAIIDLRVKTLEEKTNRYDLNIEAFWKEFDPKIRNIFSEELKKYNFKNQ